MSAVYYRVRANLRYLMRLHPQWTQPQMAQALGMSVGWVKQWQKRLREAPAEDEQVLHGRSRARKHPPERISQPVRELIVDLRDHPPEGLGRRPGPEALLYYLPRQDDLIAQGLRLPRSSRTIYHILRQAGRIVSRQREPHEPSERAAPLSAWQLDFKDASSVPADPLGKQQHVVEVLNTIDTGTSLLLSAQVAQDFTAESTLEAVAALLQAQGCPTSLRVDRDPRFVSSPAGSDFPCALVRLCSCLGIQLHICDPHSPWQNAFVERYHRSYQEECLARHRPGTLAQVRELTAQFQQHYNEVRPHQGLACGNLPPRVAFPNLPILPAVPASVDPDSWLDAWDGWQVLRTVGRDGQVSVDLRLSYVTRALAGQRVSLRLDAAERCLVVTHQLRPIKLLPLKGLYGARLSFEQFVRWMSQQARAQHRLRSLQERRARWGQASP